MWGFNARKSRVIERDASDAGQGTVEYAVVAVVLVAIVVGLWALFSVLDGGMFLDHAVGSASHSISARNSIGALGDIVLY